MEQLSTLDAGFLEAEDSDRHVSLAIAALAVIAGPMPAFDTLVEGLAERMLSVPRFSHLGDPPEQWSGASMWAILMKIHHCIADGIAATRMLAALCDDAEGGTFATKIRAAKEQPTQGRLRLPALTLNPIDWISGAWRTSLGMAAAASQAVQGAIEIAGGIMRPAASPLTGPVTSMRRYAGAHVALEDVARVCDGFGVTVNDVALAAITDSFRAVLMRRGEQPKRTSLRTLIPVSVRSNDAADKTDNRVSVSRPSAAAAISESPRRSTSKGTLALVHGGSDDVAAARA